jgi:ribonuclease-3
LSLLFSFFSSGKKVSRSLKNMLGFYPGNISLYRQAFRHSSVAREVREGFRDSNERLEYLGDAVLDLIIADFLFRKFPFKDEGFLTKMRSRIVSRDMLNLLAVKIGLDRLLDVTADTGFRSTSAAGDALEALIGAVYLDKGYRITQQFVLDRLVRLHIDLEEVERREVDFKSKIVEWSQREKKKLRFNLIEEIGYGNDKEYIVEVLVDNESKGRGQHYSKKRAEQMASEEACITLGI